MIVSRPPQTGHDRPMSHHTRSCSMALSWWWQFCRHLARAWTKKSNTPVVARSPGRATHWRPRLEALEDRRVPASLVVGSPVSLRSLPGNQDENWIAINPTDPTDVAAVTVDEGSPASHVRFFISTDGGQ